MGTKYAYVTINSAPPPPPPALAPPRSISQSLNRRVEVEVEGGGGRGGGIEGGGREEAEIGGIEGIGGARDDVDVHVHTVRPQQEITIILQRYPTLQSHLLLDLRLVRIHEPSYVSSHVVGQIMPLKALIEKKKKQQRTNERAPARGGSSGRNNITKKQVGATARHHRPIKMAHLNSSR